MKVVAFNGSPKAEGNTWYALKTVAAELETYGIATEMVHVGNKVIRGCIACNGCARNRDERCVIDDEVNNWIQLMKSADGILLGSPVHFSSIGGTMKSFLDRAFYVAGVNGGLLRHKVGASVAAVRRSGGVTTFDDLNHYINYAEMIMPGSNYWTVVHGRLPGEVDQDHEGQQTLRLLGRNMGWLLRAIDVGSKTVPPPEAEAKVYTHFVR